MDSFPNTISFRLFMQQQQQDTTTSSTTTTTTRSTMQSLYTFAFETSDTSLGNLTTADALIVLLLLVLILRRIKSICLPIFSSYGRRVARRAHGVDWEHEVENVERIQKFGEYVFRLFFHFTISVYGIAYFRNEEWWRNINSNSSSFGSSSVFTVPTPLETISLWRGFPNQEIRPGMTWYYLLQAAYNFDAMISLLELSIAGLSLQWPMVWPKNSKDTSTASSSSPSSISCYSLRSPIAVHWSPTVRGDFNEMMVHHIVTNLLVFGSSFCRLHRPGSMVFMLHDVSDVPVDLSKLANFLKYKYTTLCCFLTMVACWAVTRLYILPFVLFRSVLTQSYAVLEQGLPPVFVAFYLPLFETLMCLLILLHATWFVMFLRIFATFLRKNECHDYSEHKQGEQQQQQQQQQRDQQQLQQQQGVNNHQYQVEQQSQSSPDTTNVTVKTHNGAAKRRRNCSVTTQGEAFGDGEEKKDN
jgi:TLC domain